jgi:type IV secretory pathway VirB10-like protein
MDEQLSQIPELSRLTPTSVAKPLRTPVIVEFTATPVLVNRRRRTIVMAIAACAVIALGAVGMIALRTKAAPKPAAVPMPAETQAAVPMPAETPAAPPTPEPVVAPPPQLDPAPPEPPARPASKKTRVRPTKPEPKPEPKPLAKPELKADVKPPPKPESKPEIKDKPEPKKAHDCDADPMACRR